MEYHNRNLTPRDRLDEEFIKELLELEFDSFENERNTSSGSCGCGSTQTRRISSGESCGRSSRRTSSRNHDRCCERRRNTEQPIARNEEGSTCGSTEAVCGCGSCENFLAPRLDGVPLSMVYSPYQEWEALHEVEEALERGTLFKCLEFPFQHARCSKKSCTSGSKPSCSCKQ